MAARQPLACVLGSMDLVRPLGLAGIRCAAVAPPHAPARYSRFTDAVVEWVDPWTHAEELVERLLEFGSAQPERPVLFYEEDRDLLLVSRQRERLRGAFRFVVARAELVEDLVDKARFRALAERLDLPVPRALELQPARATPGEVDLRFPLIVKPLTRRGFERWQPLARAGKAMHVETPDALVALWPRLAEADVPVLAQEAVPGPETRVESYHAYVDESGETVAEFTGRKLRTRPREYGFSTALAITSAPEVLELGRALVTRLELTGVAKLDFKRAPDGRLHLLEVNPRFNLWHHPAALAGVNLPALVYDDLTGRPRRTTNSARAGVQWCYHLHDALAARENGVPLRRWLPWALRADAKSDLAWDDPLPFIRGVVWPQLRRRVLRA